MTDAKALTELILLLLLILTFLVQVFYYHFVFRKFGEYKKDEEVSFQEPVTIIICAKDEEDNLRNNLPAILHQEYSEFEVIVVNDCSKDGTKELLEELEKQYKHLRIITIKEEGTHNIGKKYPLTLGIKGAKYEQMLLTDADCNPVSSRWLKKMARNFSPEIDIVLGYGAYKKQPGFLNKLIRFDTFFVALQYFSLALCNRPYMGVGRNLAYKNSLFFSNKGFAPYSHIPSGDDDLFINRVATRNNTTIEIDEKAHTVSVPKNTFKGWMRQKKRHMTTGKHYKLRDKFTLGAIYLSNLSFYLFLIAVICINPKAWWIFLFLVLKITMQIVIFNKAMKKLGENDLLYIAPLLELVMVFLQPFFVLLNTFTKKHKWS